MDSINGIVFITLFAVAFTTCPCIARSDEDDAVWKNRAVEAKRIARMAYNPNPHSVIRHLNKNVHKSVHDGGSDVDNNSMHRRSLVSKRRRNTETCEATNPIDKCWRCQANWEENRRQLADCVLGFGWNATGGKAGQIYVVTDSSDNEMIKPKNGTLRHAVIQPEPLWIVFSENMVIRLSQELIMTSDKTIDGRGAKVEIVGGSGLTLQFIHNVIIHNLRFHNIQPGSGGMICDSSTHHGLRTKSDGDAINIFGSSNIWIDHVSLSSCSDGLIDVIQGSTAVTISNCHLAEHDHVLLFGAQDSYSEDKVMQVTVAFNHFDKGLIQRMPRVRFGLAHVVNNDYTQWQMYALGGSQNPTIISQGNYFLASDNQHAKEVTKRDCPSEEDGKKWLWRSENDVLMNGATFTQSGDSNYKVPLGQKCISPQPGTMAPTLSKYAGTLACNKNSPC